MKFILRRLATLLVTLFLVSVLTFIAFSIIPGDVVGSILGVDATPEREALLRSELMLDRPPVERYLHWLFGVLHGDLGVSYRYSKNMNEMVPVAELIADKLPVTLTLAFISIVLIILFSIPLGVFWARTKNNIVDGVFSFLTQFSMAIPSFFIGILVTYVFGIILRCFQPGAYVEPDKDMGAFLSYLIFPAVSVAIPKIAMTARFLRNSMLTEFRADYVRTAYSKGATKLRVMYHHVLKNAMIPVITFLGMIAAEIVAGSIVIEQVFSLPGIGRLLISSISTRDLPVVQVLILYITGVVVVVYFIIDILYRIVDPRISEK